jgi:outer membrane protein OmpA-like peptidoglycan-associated protein
MNKQSQKIRTMESEEIARWIEEMLHQTTAKLTAPDMRNEPFETQVENMVESVSALQADHKFVIEQTKEQEANIAALKNRIAALEGETKEQQAAKERLTAEKEFNEKFIQIQNYFEPEEAEVYKQGNQLVIRLKSIQFPVGKDTIMPKNYETLSKVQSAIRTFGEPDVIIEGHTDSTGSDEVNEHLSQQRAEAVRQYLVANRTLPYDRIVALGYGSMRPLASNETAEGRAINRRIDVIVRPASQLTQ